MGLWTRPARLHGLASLLWEGSSLWPWHPFLQGFHSGAHLPTMKQALCCSLLGPKTPDGDWEWWQAEGETGAYGAGSGTEELLGLAVTCLSQMGPFSP